MTPRIIDKELKKKEIIIAALRVFSRKGVTNSRVAEIAEEAGIGKGTIYEYFKNKDEIFLATFSYFMNQAEKVVMERIAVEKDPVAKLEAWIDGWLEAIFESIDYVSIMMEYWAEGVRTRNENSIFAMKEMYEEYRNTIKDILDAGVQSGKIKPVDTSMVASVLLGTLDGLALQWILDPDLFHFKKASETLKNSLIGGIVKEQ